MSAAPVISQHHNEPATQRRTRGWVFVWSMGLILLFGFLLWLVLVIAKPSFQDAWEQRAQERYKTLNEVMEADKKALSAPPSWLDPQKKTVRLPIDQAMAITVKELHSQTPHVADPIENLNSAPAPAPAPKQ